jgi:broad specificity phosphatase PhoE
VIVVTHGGVLSALVWELSGCSYEALPKAVGNCSVTTVDYDRAAGTFAVVASFENVIGEAALNDGSLAR